MSSENRGFYKNIISPFLDRACHSEEFHVTARKLLHISESNPITLRTLEYFAYKHKRFRDLRLQVNVGGVYLESPLVVGAGWTKDGEALRALYQLGFAGVEVGSILAFPQPGNDKPRQWMVGKGVSLNRLGFNAESMEKIAANLDRYKKDGIPTGISVGKNKNVPLSNAPFAHAIVTSYMYDYASWFVANVSSPNTKDVRDQQEKHILTDIVQSMIDAMKFRGGVKPFFVKISPELTYEQLDDVIEVVIDNNLSGMIATNTTTNEKIKTKYGVGNEAGGLAGDDEDYRNMVTEKVKYIYKQVGDRIDIIRSGAIKDTQTAIQGIRAGAKGLEIVTAIRGEGTGVAGRINRGIVDYMDNEGIKNIKELVGVDVR